MKKILATIALLMLAVLSACNLPISAPSISAPTSTRLAVRTQIIIPPTVTLPAITQLAPATIPAVSTPVVVTQTTSPLATSTLQPTSSSGSTSVASSGGQVRLKFAVGGTAADVNDTVSAGTKKQYLVNAQAGQTMLLTLSTSASDVYLAVTGNQGSQKLLTTTSKAQSFRGVLPSSQDYLIEVVGGSSDASFGLDVTIPARVKFASGATTSSYTGPIQSKAIVTFLARASANQTMTVTLTSSKSDVLLTIYGLNDGSPLVRSTSGATTWTGKLPATQDYVIQAVSTGSTTTFTMKLTIK